MSRPRSLAVEFYEARLAEALQELRTSPIPPAAHFPWPQRLLRRLGLRVRPPLYAPFAINALVTGAWFGGALAIVAWVGSRLGWAGGSPLSMALLGVLVMGPFTALWTSIAAWRHALSPWRELGAGTAVESSA